MERLLEVLRNAGIPVQYLTGFSKETLGFVYSSDPTDKTLQDVANILKNFDWSSAADEKWIADKKRAELVAFIDSDEPQAILIRSLQQMVYGSVKSMTEKVNEIITKVSDGKVEVLAITKEGTDLIDELKGTIIVNQKPDVVVGVDVIDMGVK